MDLFLSKKWKWIWIPLCLLNLLISGTAINQSINLIINEQDTKKANQTINDYKQEAINVQEKDDN